MTVSVRAFTRNRFGRIEYVAAHERSDHGRGYSISKTQPLDMDAIRVRRREIALNKHFHALFCKAHHQPYFKAHILSDLQLTKLGVQS